MSNYKKTGFKKSINASLIFNYLNAFKQTMRSNEEVIKIMEENKIVEGDRQSTIDSKIENLKKTYAEENQKAGVNYFIIEFGKFLTKHMQNEPKK